MTKDKLDEAVREILSGRDCIGLPAQLVEEGAPEEAARSLYAQVQDMTVIEKIKLALKGNREARTLLLRDGDRMVPRFVLQNPRITEDEIAALVKNRGADGELLRLAAQNRDWVKHYPVKLGLVENPRTPLTIAMRLLPLLQERDIRALSKNKGVQTTIAAQAKRLVMRREGSRT